MADFRTSDPYLRNRYGISERRNALRWVLLIALISLSWLIWSAIYHSTPAIRSALISFQVRNSSAVELRYSVDVAEPNRSHICRVIARDYSMNLVGQVDDRLPTGVAHMERTIVIHTRAQAVNAGIELCTTL